MANNDTVPMLSEFPRWMAAIELGADQARHNARWAAVSALARDVNRTSAEALIRVALKSRHDASAPLLQKIRDAFYAADNTFEMQGNDKELQVLAGATLAAAMTLSDDSAAALAVAVALAGGHRKSDLPMDLNVLSHAAIDRIAEVNRKRPNLATFVVTDVPKFDFEKASAKAKEGNFDHVAAAFGLAADATRAAFSVMTKRQANAINALDRFLRVQDEELQMLWWLTGERSVDLGQRFDAVKAELQPLVFAKELADTTEYLPGPRSVRALLSRAGLKDRKKAAVAEVINAADPAWLKTLMPEGELSPVTTPFHLGIRRQLETGAGDAWIAGWSAAVGLPADFGMSPLALGVHIYRERLLLLFDGE